MSQDKSTIYSSILAQAKALTTDEHDMIANMANLSALLFNNLQQVNWAGFYLYKQQQLVLGPFQGQPACIRIPMGKGVCGTAAAQRQVQVVEDVHSFDGHIACDAASNSEIVLPIVHQGELIGVLDIDSPAFSRFDQDDADWLQHVVACLEHSTL